MQPTDMLIDNIYYHYYMPANILSHKIQIRLQTYKKLQIIIILAAALYNLYCYLFILLSKQDGITENLQE